MNQADNRPEQRTPAKTRSGYTRRRQGCLTCRQRKKKCDSTYPICGHCSRLNLLCQREAPRTVSAGPVGERAVTPPPLAPSPDTNPNIIKLYATVDLGSNLFDDSCTADMVASRRAMLRYYTSSFAFMLTTNLENNCFLSVLLPMAFESPSLMRALAAWSSTHLALRDPSFEDIALRHRGSAISSLKSAMEDDGITREMCLAVTMVFCSMESISNGSSLSWYHHLVGGAAALGADNAFMDLPAGSSGSSGSPSIRIPAFEGAWLLRNFAYHDIMMSVAMDQRPLLDGDYWILDEEQKADPYFGLGSYILYLVAEISHLNADFTAEATPGAQQPCPRDCLHSKVQGHSVLLYHSEAPPRGAHFSSRARAIETELQGWQCPTAYLGSQLEQLANCYRSAGLLHLYRTLRKHTTGYDDVLRDKIYQNVDTICAVTEQMPHGCLAECTLLFPLFLAGGEAKGTEQIKVIRERLLTLNRWRHFHNVETCLSVLDELWRLRASEARTRDSHPPDWSDVVKARGYTLSIT